MFSLSPLTYTAENKLQLKKVGKRVDIIYFWRESHNGGEATSPLWIGVSLLVNFSFTSKPFLKKQQSCFLNAKGTFAAHAMHLNGSMPRASGKVDGGACAAQ